MRLATLLLIMALATAAFADPRMWEPSGRMIRGEGPVYFNSSVTNADGLTLLVWVDEESGQGDIWGQLVDSAGNPQWGTQGRQIMATSTVEDSVSAFAWQEGFMLAFKRRIRPWNEADLFMCPIDLEGNPLWLQNNGTGVQVNHAPIHNGDFENIFCIADGSVTYLYRDWAPHFDQFTLYANRISSVGNVIWDEPLQPLEESVVYWSHNRSFQADNNGGLFVLRWVQVGVYVPQLLRYDTLANEVWQIDLGEDNEIVSNRSLVYNATEGCYLVWEKLINGSRQLVAQQFNDNGGTLWDNPVVVDSIWQEKDFIKAIPNNEEGTDSGILLVWDVFNNTPHDSSGLHVQKVRNTGETAWNPIRLMQECSSRPDLQQIISFESDHTGGFVATVAMEEWAGGHYRSWRQLARVSSDGTPMWGGPCGVNAFSENYWAYNPIVEASRSNSVVLSWSQHDDGNFVKSVLFDKSTGTRVGPELGIEWAAGMEYGVDKLRTMQLEGGNAVIMWMDGRDGYDSNGLYYQIMTPNGAIMPETHGRALYPMWSSTGQDFDLCEDGQGGFFVFSLPESEDSTRFSVSHIGPNGAHLSDSSGIQLCAQSRNYFDKKVRCTMSDRGYLYLAWQQATANPNRVNLQRFGFDLVPIWTEPLSVESHGESGSLMDVVAAPDDGCIVIWNRGNDLYITKFSDVGLVAWGALLTSSFRFWGQAQAKFDEVGNLYIFWEDTRPTDNFSALYGQAIGSNGIGIFDFGGILVADSVDGFDYQDQVFMTSDGPLVVFQREEADYIRRLYANKLSYSLLPLWGTPGLLLSSEQDYASTFSAITDGNEGIVVAAGVFRDGGDELLAKHINKDGRITDQYWSHSGGVICDTSGTQSDPVLASGGEANKFFCFWRDSRTSEQLFGQYVEERPTSTSSEKPAIPTDISLSQNYPNPFNANTEIVFSLPRAMNAKLRVFDVTGRLVRTLADEQFMAGEHRIALDARDVASGVYFYELRAGDTKVARKMLLLK